MSPRPHVLAIAYPAQGHVIPLLELAQRLTKHGLRVTFVNSDFNHKRVVSAAESMDFLGDHIRLVSIPDGLGPDDDRKDPVKATEAMFRVMPGELEKLIQEINSKEADKVTCMLADVSMNWPVDVAVKLNMPRAVFWPASVALLASGLAIPKLIRDGILTDDGSVTGQQTFRLASSMPVMSAANLVWLNMGSDDSVTQRTFFDCIVKDAEATKLADWIICNSSRALEPGALEFIPEMKPIGPLLAEDRLGNSAGYFWAEDSSCLNWLDDQPPHSVIYVAFGSTAIFDQAQFHELALGLELTGRPFLWVVRPGTHTENMNGPYPSGFRDRVSGRAKIVRWAPQQRVLSHPSVACFVSHCGWNSTMEATSNGVPMLCWPYFADQFLNEDYVCDQWKTGLRFERDKKGIITRDEIKVKVDKLLDNGGFIRRAKDLMEVVKEGVHEGGECNKNFSSFVEWIKSL